MQRNERNNKKIKELIKYMTTEELTQKLKEHNTAIYPEKSFEIIAEELESRRKAQAKNKPGNRFQGLFVAGGLILILLAGTNPTKEEYVEYLNSQGGQQITVSAAAQTNYLLCTRFTTEISGQTKETLGILKRFIPLGQ